ncbi:MAG: ThuA domain-containing protein [Pseudomonadota bacterium]
MRLIALFLLCSQIIACRALPERVPTTARQYDVTPPDINKFMSQPAILVFSKTLGWRHNEGIAGADYFFVRLARERQYGIFTTVNAAVFNDASLARFDIVVFNNMSGDGLTTEQQDAFQRWLESGGGWIGIHGSGDGSQSDWPWYQQQLIGPTFIGHPADPQFQRARVETIETAHPVMAGIPSQWWHTEEWYSFDSRAQDHGALVLAGIDETSYRPRNNVYGDVADLRMGTGAINHPIIWSRCPGEGRAVYSAIGHSDKSYEDAVYARLLNNAFDWVSGASDQDGSGCPH